MYDNDAITLFYEQSGAGSHEFIGSGVHTIISYSIQQSGQASDTLLKCGSTTFARNYAKDSTYNQVSIHCNEAISVTKTGNDSIFVSVTYIPRDNRKYPQVLPMSIASTSANLINTIGFNNGLLLAMNGLSWVIYIGFAVMIILTSIRLGYLFLQK